MVLLSEFTSFVYADIRCQTSRFKMYLELFSEITFSNIDPGTPRFSLVP